MALTITSAQLTVANSYAASGDYKGGWQYLASIGDNYADNAYAVTSGNATGVDKHMKYLSKFTGRILRVLMPTTQSLIRWLNSIFGNMLRTLTPIL